MLNFFSIILFLHVMRRVFGVCFQSSFRSFSFLHCRLLIFCTLFVGGRTPHTEIWVSLLRRSEQQRILLIERG